MFSLVPILAAGESWISILFVVIAFISWLWNVFNGNQKPVGGGVQPQAAGGKRGDKVLQAEINRFLKNVMGQKDGQADELEVLVVEEGPTKPRSKGKNRSKRPATPAASTESAAVFSGARPGGRISERKGPGSTTLGAGVRQHLADHMQEGRVLKQAQSHLAHGVADKVQQDLGSFTAPDAPTAASATAARTKFTANDVAKLMRDPAGIKQAFVLNLILNRRPFGSRRG
jgi:hypothetical protein